MRFIRYTILCATIAVAAIATSPQRVGSQVTPDPVWALCGKASLPPVASYDWFCLGAPGFGGTTEWQAGGLQVDPQLPSDLSTDLCGAAAIAGEEIDPACWKIDAVIPAEAIDTEGKICAPLNMPGVGTWEWFCYDLTERTWRAGGFAPAE